MKTAVTGAFSCSGKYITHRLLAQGQEVITLTGHPNRPDPFGGRVEVFPLDFDEAGMAASLSAVDTLYNTYWVRFDKACRRKYARTGARGGAGRGAAYRPY